MNKILVVVDMQNDFLTGSLANESAVKVIPNIKREIESGKYTHIIFTRDSHTENYLNTQEGKHLPVTHCIIESKGWDVCVMNSSIPILEKLNLCSLTSLPSVTRTGKHIFIRMVLMAMILNLHSLELLDPYVLSIMH